MVLLWVFAIGAAASYAAANVLIRRGLQGSNPHASVLVSLATNVVIMWALVIFFVPLSFFLNWKALAIFAVAGILAPGIARMLRYTSLERLGVAKSTPITSVSPLVSISIAVVFLGEKLTLPIILGTLLIILGVIAVSQRGNIGRKDLLFALGAAFFAGVSTPIRKYGLSVLDSPVLSGVVTASVALLIALTIIAVTGGIRQISLKDKGTKFYIYSGVFTSMAFIFNFTALSKGAVSVVAPLIQTMPIFALFLSHFFIGHLEKITKNVWIGTLLVVAGAVLVGAG